jgi:holo-[acyl-carrier protein] synthase
MIGIDMISLSRMEETIKRSGKAFLQRVFSEAEIQKANSAQNATCFFASAFAAKEAVFKALDLGWEQEVDFREIQVSRDPGGKPIVTLLNQVAERARSKGHHQVLISISYETDLAIALAMVRD